MVYITGDTHGEFDRFRSKQMRVVKPGDTLIICGDFGFLWDDSRREQQTLKKLSALPYQICFLDGCHENYDMLERCPTEDRFGAPVHRVGRNIVHLMRGQIYTIEENTYFTFGGGHSQDFEYRMELDSWWRQERPTKQEIQTAIDHLEARGNQVDYVLTHEPPASLKDCLGVDVGERLEVHTFFEDIVKACIYRKWFFGKCHLNKYVPVKFYAVFDAVLPVTIKNTELRKYGV